MEIFDCLEYLRIVRLASLLRLERLVEILVCNLNIAHYQASGGQVGCELAIRHPGIFKRQVKTQKHIIYSKQLYPVEVISDCV